MTPLEDAQTLVLERVPAARPRSTMPLDEASGLVLAADVVAGEQVPPFANTAVDGYAVRAADVADAPVELRRRRRGRGRRRRPIVSSAPGEAIRIMTGAPMPAGADAVVMVEDTERLDGRPGAHQRGGRRRERRCAPPATTSGGRPAVHGRHRGPPGRRRRAGQRQRPDRDGPSAADAWPCCRRRRAGRRRSPLRPGQIRESNRTMLAGAARRGRVRRGRLRHGPRRRG